MSQTQKIPWALPCLPFFLLSFRLIVITFISIFRLRKESQEMHSQCHFASIVSSAGLGHLDPTLKHTHTSLQTHFTSHNQRYSQVPCLRSNLLIVLHAHLVCFYLFASFIIKDFYLTSILCSALWVQIQTKTSQCLFPAVCMYS